MWLEVISILLFVNYSPLLVPPDHWIRFYLLYLSYTFFGILSAVFLYPLYLYNTELHSRIILKIIYNISSNNKISWKVINQETFRKQKCAVVVINHQSFFDFISVLVMNGGVQSITGIAKKELVYIFPVYLILKMYNCGFIDRKKPKESLETMSQMLKNKNRKVCIFPEGTRNKHDNGFLPFKKGAFKVAIANKVPILPTVISPYYFIKQGEVCTEGMVKISCLEPIETKDLQEKDVDDLLNKTRQLMETEFLKLKTEVLKEHEELHNCVYKINRKVFLNTAK